MKQSSISCAAGDCPSLDGGPVSAAHERRHTASAVRMAPVSAGVVSMPSETSGAPAMTITDAVNNGAKRTKRENGGASAL